MVDEYISLYIVFIPLRHILSERSIDSLIFHQMSFKKHIKIKKVNALIAFQLTQPNYEEYRIVLFNPKRSNAIIKSYRTLENTKLSDIKTLLKNNLSKLTKGDFVEVKNILELLPLNYKIAELKLKDDEIILFECFEDSSLFSFVRITQPSNVNNQRPNTTTAESYQKKNMLSQNPKTSVIQNSNSDYSMEHLKNLDISSDYNVSKPKQSLLSKSSFNSSQKQIQPIKNDKSKLNYTLNNEITEIHHINESFEPFTIFEELNEQKLNNRLIGLANLGNTCYMNAALQCLFRCNDLNNYFLTDRYKQDLIIDSLVNNTLLEKYVKLVKSYFQKQEINRELQEFNFNFKHFYLQFNNLEQHDMDEFLSKFIDYLLSGFKSQSLVHKIFKGKLKHTHKCVKCKSVNYSEESIITLNVSLSNPNLQTIDCYFNFNNNQTQPYLFQYKVTDNTTLQEINSTLTKALCIPTNSLEIVLYNHYFFQIVTKELGSVIKIINNKEAKLCFIFITIDPQTTPIKITEVDSMFLTLKSENREMSSIQNNYIGNQIVFDDLVKCIFFHEVFNETNHPLIEFLPNIFYVSKRFKFSDLYSDLIAYYSNIFNDIQKDDFTQKKNFNFETALINPFIITFQRIESSNTLFFKFDASRKKVLNDSLEYSLTDLIRSYANEYLTKNTSSYQFVFKIVWNPNRVNNLLQQNQSKTIYIPLFNPIYDIHQCLGKFFEKENIGAENSLDCEKCKSKQPIEKKIDMLQLPELMIIQLKRLQKHQKIMSVINYPLIDFDIRKYLSHDVNDNNNFNYELIAVGNHEQGELPQTGHYTAYIRTDDNLWYEMSDDKAIRSINEKDIITPNSYLLFYQKKTE